MDDVTRLRDRAYLDLLHYGLVLLRNFARGGRLEFCPVEAEHLHELPRLVGVEYEGAHMYYLRGTRKLYLDKLRAICEAEYLKQVSIWYAEPWQVLAEAAGMRLPAWDQEVEPGTAPDPAT